MTRLVKQQIVQTAGTTVDSTVWRAFLDLVLSHDGTQSYLSKRVHHGPLRIQKALWPESPSICHLIIVHPPAGIVSGDQLKIELSAQVGSHGVVTTPGAAKWYKSDGRFATQETVLTVDSGAVLEWMPQESIVFDGAAIDTQLRIALAQQAVFIGWDIVSFGRSAQGEKFHKGQYCQRVILQVGDTIWLEEALQVVGGDRWLDSPLGLAGNHTMGTLWAVAPEILRSNTQLDEHISIMRELIMRLQMPLTMTRLDQLLVVRYVGNDAREAMAGFAACRAKLRRLWLDLDEAYPRIWKT